MTIIGEPQRLYLSKRHKKAYNIKYDIYEFVSNNIQKNCRILEMFGGIGIMTHFLVENAAPFLDRVYEIDPLCADFLKKTYNGYENVEIIEGDSFQESLDFDYIFIDGSNFSASNMETYKPLLELLSLKSGEVFITDSGYFHMRYTKAAERPEAIQKYYDNYKQIFLKYGLNLSKVFIGNEFAVLHLVREPVPNMLFQFWTDETKEWEKTVTKFNSFQWNYKGK